MTGARNLLAKADSLEGLGETWHESDLHRDRETRLPTRLYPFEIDLDDDDERWLLWENHHDGRKPRRLGIYSSIFPAFRGMLDAYEAWLPNRPREQVYFIGTELRVGAMVKIGYSVSPEARLRALQTSNAEPLRIFATTPGGRSLEAKYHQRWHARRRNGGEWFVVGEPILAEIARLTPNER